MTGLWQSISSAAPELIRTMARHEVQTALFIIFLLAVDSLLRRPSPRFRYFLWLVALAKALWPPFLSLSALDIWGRQTAVAETLAPIFAAPITLMTPVEPAGFTLTWGALALAAWTALSLLVLSLMVVNFVRFRLRLRPPHVEPYHFDEPQSAIGRPWPPIWATDRVHSPLTVGLLRPRIYLTWKIIASGPRALRAILYHELAHILRRDGWITILQAVALVIHPFNPLVWLMNARLSRYREQLCDDFALKHTGVAPKDYGNMLLDQLSQGKLPLLAIHTPTYFFETKRDLVHRLSELTRRKGEVTRIITRPQKVLLAVLMFGLLFVTSQCNQEADSVADTQENLSEPSESGEPIVIVSTPPRPVGGWQTLMQNVVYPPEAKEAGVSGRVAIEAFIDQNGKVTETIILQSPNASLTEAAIEAIRRTSWEPAELEDGSPFGVHIAIPINFTLDDPSTPKPSGGTREAAMGTQRNPSSPPTSNATSVRPFTPPRPVGGMEGILSNLVYPPEAKEAGLSGVVVLDVFIDQNGEVTVTRVRQSPDPSLSEAASEAVRKTRWIPAKRDGTPMGMGTSFPIQFTLSDTL